jgi:hypothetical protein
MKQHKWHKEIKAWADGAEIEFYHSSYAKWVNAPYNPDWSGNIKYRIKPHPKEPQYMYVYEDSFYDGDTDTRKATRIMNQPIKEWGFIYLGKIKLENDDAM